MEPVARRWCADDGGEGAEGGEVREGAGEARSAAAACSSPSPPAAALTRNPRALLLAPLAGVVRPTPTPHPEVAPRPTTEREVAARDAVVQAAPANRGVLGGGAPPASDDDTDASPCFEPAPLLPARGVEVPALATGVAAVTPDVLIHRAAAAA